MYDTLINRIKTDDNDEAAFLELGNRLILSGNFTGLTEILTYRAARGKSGSALAFELCRQLILKGELEAVLKISSCFGDLSPFSAAFYCARSFIHFARFDHITGTVCLREGTRRLYLLADQYPSETLAPLFQASMFQISFLFDPPAGEPKVNDEIPDLAILHHGAGDRCKGVSAAFGDSRYFQSYAARLAQTFFSHSGPGNGLFIGIINPDADALGLAQALSLRHPALTIATTRYNGDLLPEYCCSARFLFANRLLNMFNAPLVLFDIDNSFSDGCAKVLNIIRTFPLSYVRTQDIWPHLMISAAVVGAHP